MDVLANLALGFGVALTLKNLYLAFIGCLWGTVVGVLPGIGPVAGITLLIPATFGIDATGAIISPAAAGAADSVCGVRGRVAGAA